MTHVRQRRWYDQDPLVSDAMLTLENASDTEQIQLALHVIKIVNEHHLEHDGTPTSLTAKDTVAAQVTNAVNNSRWYDLDMTLKTSIEMLRCCDLDTQKLIAREIVEMLKEYGEDR